MVGWRRLCLFAKRVERGRFVRSRAEAGAALLTRAQLSMLLEGINYKAFASLETSHYVLRETVRVPLLSGRWTRQSPKQIHV